MPTPLNPTTAESAPKTPSLTSYDEEHLIVYLRLLDAAADNANWREVARVVLNLDPERDPVGAHETWESHLARARWMTESGYRHLLTSPSEL